MFFVLLVFYFASIAVVAGLLALLLRLIAPGFPFWIGFLIAFTGTFLTLLVTGMVIGMNALHHH